MQRIGEMIHIEVALDAATITAGAGNDGVEVAGRIIDLAALPGGKGAYDSVSLELGWKASIASGKTLTYAANFEHGDNSGLADTADLAPALGATVAATGVLTAAYGSCKGPTVDLKQAKRYLRAMITADLSASGTDTVLTTAVLVFKANRRPAT